MTQKTIRKIDAALKARIALEAPRNTQGEQKHENST